MLTIQNYQKAESIEEAWDMNQQKGNRVLGGMLWLKQGDGRIRTAIDLSGLGLDMIEEDENEIRIGCMVTLRQLETNKAINRYTCGAAREAVRHIVGVQFRNLATVGGSIYGRYGFSDVFTLFLAMDSFVELYQGGIVSMREFADMPFDRDILVRVIVKKRPARYFYQSVRNAQTDFPVLTCAGAVFADSGAQRYRVAVGARPARAVLVEDGRDILISGVTDETARSFGTYVSDTVAVGSNTRAGAAYRKRLAAVLAQRAVRELSLYAQEGF